MNTADGTMLLKVGKKYKAVDCSRWSEIGECLKFHINLSRQALAPSQFRFCNSGSPVMLGDHKGNPNLKKAEEAHQKMTGKGGASSLSEAGSEDDAFSGLETEKSSDKQSSKNNKKDKNDSEQTTLALEGDA
jgi:hypothetical protein